MLTLPLHYPQHIYHVLVVGISLITIYTHHHYLHYLPSQGSIAELTYNTTLIL